MGQAERSPRHRGEGSRALLIQDLQALAQGLAQGGTAVEALRVWEATLKTLASVSRQRGLWALSRGMSPDGFHGTCDPHRRWQPLPFPSGRLGIKFF